MNRKKKQESTLYTGGWGGGWIPISSGDMEPLSIITPIPTRAAFCGIAQPEFE
jgi:hypothetical protein